MCVRERVRMSESQYVTQVDFELRVLCLCFSCIPDSGSGLQHPRNGKDREMTNSSLVVRD